MAKAALWGPFRKNYRQKLYATTFMFICEVYFSLDALVFALLYVLLKRVCGLHI
jgi:hypothetical protein